MRLLLLPAVTRRMRYPSGLISASPSHSYMLRSPFTSSHKSETSHERDHQNTNIILPVETEGGAGHSNQISSDLLSDINPYDYVRTLDTTITPEQRVNVEKLKKQIRGGPNTPRSKISVTNLIFHYIYEGPLPRYIQECPDATGTRRTLWQQ